MIQPLYAYYYAIIQAPVSHYVIWAILAAVTIALWIALRRQNRTYHAVAAEDTIRTQLQHMSRVRGNVALALWILLCGTVIAWDIEKIMYTTPLYPHNDEPVGVISDADVPQHYGIYNANDTPSTPVLTLADTEASLDSIKSSYEEAFINYLILRECDADNPDDYDTLYRAMQHNLRARNQPDSAADNILDAATGSYQSLYFGMACDSGNLASIQASLSQFIAAVRIP